MYPDPKITKSEGAEVIYESEAGQIIRGWDRAAVGGDLQTEVIMAVTPDGQFTILDVKQRTNFMKEKCQTCGAQLAPGEKPGNHVRGGNDEFCDKCVDKQPITSLPIKDRPFSYWGW